MTRNILIFTAIVLCSHYLIDTVPRICPCLQPRDAKECQAVNRIGNQKRSVVGGIIFAPASAAGLMQQDN